MKSIFHKIRQRLKGNSNELIPKKSIKKYLPDNPVIIDAGAHTGGDSIEMSHIWKKAIIHAFEPFPEIYKQLVSNTSSQSNIYTYPLALSSKTGEADFFVSSGKSDASSSLLQPKEHIVRHPDVLFSQKMRINTITLDEWALRNKVTRVDFAWLDMQGVELEVLRASETIIKTIKVIFTEVNLIETYEGVALYSEYRTWLESIGFRVVKEDFHWEGREQGNVLFVRDKDMQ